MPPLDVSSNIFQSLKYEISTQTLIMPRQQLHLRPGNWQASL